MTCPEIPRTQAFIDGEATGAEAEAIERHIAGCARCQAFCEAAATLSEDIRRLAPRHAAPAPLRARVARMLDAEAARRAPRRGFWQGALVGAGAAGLAAALAGVMLLPPSAGTLADQVIEAHDRALMSGREIAVASSDHHTVKPWFAGRIDLSPPVSDFAAQGFKLAGGRRDRVAGAPAAVLAYRHGLHEIDLFVWADRGGTLPPAGLRHGLHAVLWKAGDLDFAAVSDTAPAELAAFVKLVQAEAL
jgi:anti-sigma factor RsiW